MRFDCVYDTHSNERSNNMRALVIHSAKDLRIETRETKEPGPGEVAVRMARGGICGSDLHYFNHGGFGAIRLREPMILGHEVSGHITALGEGVTGLREGALVASARRGLAARVIIAGAGRGTTASIWRSMAAQCPSPISKARFPKR